jgi:hypothetical protein
LGITDLRPTSEKATARKLSVVKREIRDPLQMSQQYTSAMSDVTETRDTKQKRPVSGNTPPSITENVERLIGGDVLTSLIASVHSAALERIQQNLDRMLEQMREDDRRFPATTDLLLKLGWPPFLNASLRQMNALLDVAEQGGFAAAKTQVQRLALRLYDDKAIGLMLDVWNRAPLLSRRIHLLRAGVNAHLRGDYACSVPILLPQAEGVVFDCFRGVKELELARQDALLDRLIRSNPFDEDPDSVLDKFAQAVHDYYLRQVLVSIGRLDELPDSMNRHVILHGRDVAYNTKLNSTRAIILIDYLRSSLILLSTPSSRVYHRSGCPVVFRSRAKFTIVRDMRVARDAGKRPCRICVPPAW